MLPHPWSPAPGDGCGAHRHRRRRRDVPGGTARDAGPLVRVAGPIARGPARGRTPGRTLGLARALAAAALAALPVAPARAGDATGGAAPPASRTPAPRPPAAGRHGDAAGRAKRPGLPVVRGAPVTVRGRTPAAGARSPTRSGTTVDLSAPAGIPLDLSAPLARVPEVALHRYGAPGSLTTISLRGTAADQAVVRLGGLPLTPPGGGTVDLSLIPPALLASLRVTPGAQGARAGAGALGGVVDLEPLGARRGPALSATVTGGSFGTGSAAVRGRLDTGGSRVAAAATVQTSAGDFPFQRDLTPAIPGRGWTTQSRANAASRLGAGLVHAAVDLSGGVVTLTGLGAAAHRQVPGMVGFPTPGATDDTWRALAGAVFQGAPRGPAALRLSARGWLAADGDAYAPGSAPVAGSPARSARTVVGAAAGVTGVALGQVVTAHLGATFEHLDTLATTAERATASLRLTDTAWLAGDRLALDGAVRLEAFTGHGLEVLPAVGVRYRAGRILRLEANVARAVRMPTLYELNADTALIRANPALRPESAYTADLAAVLHGAAGRLRVAVYASREHDLIAYELYPPLRLTPANLRDARILGLEVDGRLALPLGLALTGGYAFTGATVLGDIPNEAGEALPNRPPHRGLVRLAFHRGRVRAFVEAEAEARYPRNRANTRFVPARFLLGLGARVRLARGLSVAAEVDNLLDDERLQDVYGYPLPGRTVLVSLRYALQGAPR